MSKSCKFASYNLKMKKMKTILVTITLLFTVAFGLKAENKEPLNKGQEINIKADVEKPSRIYTWEIVTQNGRAKGVSLSEAHAKKMIDSFSKGDILEFKKITSRTHNY